MTSAILNRNRLGGSYTLTFCVKRLLSNNNKSRTGHVAMANASFHCACLSPGYTFRWSSSCLGAIALSVDEPSRASAIVAVLLWEDSSCGFRAASHVVRSFSGLRFRTVCGLRRLWEFRLNSALEIDSTPLVKLPALRIGQTKIIIFDDEVPMTHDIYLHFHLS